MPLRLNKYLSTLRLNASKWERLDINGKKDNNFVSRNLRKGLSIAVSAYLVFLLHTGFQDEFISYVSTVLSILIGLFITAIIFSFDKFHNNLVKELNDYDINIKRLDKEFPDKKLQISVKEIIEPNAKQKLWDTQSYNYSKQFAFITGYNIVLSIYALALLLLSSLFPTQFGVDVSTLTFKLHNIGYSEFKLFVLATVVISQRFFVLYWIISIMYNTLFVVSSMVNFMAAKIDRTNV